MPANVPFLPGHVMNDLSRNNHSRPQTLVYKLDCASDNFARKSAPLSDEVLKRLAPGHTPRSARTEGRSPRLTPRNTYRPSIEPAWLKHDKQVLRFYAYFQEPVVESPNENHRVRKCIITYYLEDGTLQITEPKVENSGIWPQGPLLARHKIPKGDRGEHFGPEDIQCGATVTIYSRAFRVTSCDEFTRTFYKNAGFAIGTDEATPSDQYNEVTSARKEISLSLTGTPREIMESKQYNELKLGGSRKNQKLDQFLSNDRKVLRLYAYWDDTTRYGTRQYFVVHYFLCDDTVEILNTYGKNSGRDPYPVFFTRGPLTLNPSFKISPGMADPADEKHLSPSDITIGKTFPVFGRPFFVYGCDDATRAFYKTYLGIGMQDIPIPKEAKVHVKLQYPPHTGFGLEEDSLGCCLSLEPKPPRHDMVKLVSNSDVVMRYEARAENGVPEDANRKFVIGMFMRDDEVAVWEKRSRNSGFVEGKFSEKGKKINPDTGKPFKPSDFYVGARVRISAMPFFIIRADEYALKFMEKHPDIYPLSSINFVVQKLVGLDAEPAPEAMGPEQFRAHVAQKLGVELTDQEVVTVLRRCSNSTAEIVMGRLFEIIQSGGVRGPLSPGVTQQVTQAC